jgi:molybdopterin synthase catalytic subunit
MVEVTVRFFATLRDRAGLESARIKLPDTAATVPALLDQIADMFPATAPALPTAIVAVNHEYVFGEHILGDGDEVALFPPVSGGNDNTWPEYFAIT